MPVEGSLEVELIRGHGLRDVEGHGKSDPYALLSCGQVKHRSRVATDAGGNPVWEQNFLFEGINDGNKELEISILDDEKKGKDVPIGSLRVPLTHVFSHHQAPPTKYKVQLPNGKMQGEIELSMKFFTKVHHGKLDVHLVDGHGLIPNDLLSKTDPYVVLTCDKQKHKSKVIKNAGADAVWNENFVFEIGSDVTELRCELFDKDTFTKDDALGNATVPLRTVFIGGQSAPTNYRVQGKNGQAQGELKVGLKFTPKAV